MAGASGPRPADPTDVEALAEAGCTTAALDVTDSDQVTRVVERLIEAEGQIDCLVNNAGYGQAGAVEDVPLDQIHAQFDVNVYGIIRLIKTVLPQMRAQGDGTIVNILQFHWTDGVFTPGNLCEFETRA